MDNNLKIYIPKKEEESNKHHKYNKGFFINNIDSNINTNFNINDKVCNIPLKLKELPPIEYYERYNQTKYVLLKFEILEFNDFITLYLKRITKNYIIPNLNLEYNIAKKYFNIKELEISMK